MMGLSLGFQGFREFRFWGVKGSGVQAELIAAVVCSLLKVHIFLQATRMGTRITSYADGRRPDRNVEKGHDTYLKKNLTRKQPRSSNYPLSGPKYPLSAAF